MLAPVWESCSTEHRTNTAPRCTHNRPALSCAWGRMERVSRAFLFHEDLATHDEGASLEEALEHVLWCA